MDTPWAWHNMKRLAANLAVVALFLMSGCSVDTATHVIPQLPSPLLPMSKGMGIVVWIENLCEEPGEDAKTFTTLEAFADIFLMPVIAGVYVARVSAMVFVALPMAYMGHDMEVTVERIKLSLPYPTSGPNPDTTDYKNIQAVESCLL